MSENVTLETIVDDAGDILEEDYEHSEKMSKVIGIIIPNFEIYYVALIVAIGIPCNILALLLLVRRRLWHQHEAYVYVAAILITNILEMVIHHSNRLVQHIMNRYSGFSIISDITCKVWQWSVLMIICVYWLHVLMVLNVYLRQQLIMSSDRTGWFLNLADKYCSLLGSKVVVISFLAFWAVAFSWNFAISNLEVSGEFRKRCTVVSDNNRRQYHLLAKSTVWFGMNLPVVVGILLILLIVWKKKRSSRFVFNQVNGAHLQDDGDVEAMAKIVLWCATLFFVLRAPLNVVYMIYTCEPDYVYNSHYQIVLNSFVLLSFSHPPSTPIVCFTVKSRFRNELRSIIKECCCRHCCSGTKLQKMLSQEADDNGSSVLQMHPIEDDLNIAGNDEESNLPNRRDT